MAKPNPPAVVTEKEAAAVDRHLQRRQAAPPAPKLKIRQTGHTAQLELQHRDPLAATAMLMESIGTTDPAFLDGLMGGFANAGKGESGKVDQQAVDFMLAVVQGIQPQDQLEAMLAGQMAVVHRAVMEATRRLTHAQTIQQAQLHEGTLNRLARTYATQLEALKRYRSGGQQRMVVEHVTVHEGGQAIVGNVATGTGVGTRKKGTQSHESD